MKFIVQNKVDWLSNSKALELCSKVADMGYISTGTYGEQYCHLTTWTLRDKESGVSVDKRKSGTQRFIIFEMKAKQ